MSLTFDPERQVKTSICECCGGERQSVTGYIYEHGDAHAVYYASCYPHQGEVWIDVIFGTWGVDVHDDHVTFGCRYGLVMGQSEPACSLVPAATIFPDDDLFGLKLDRDQALKRPLLSHFWQVVDFILIQDPTVRQHVYGGQSQ